MQQENGLIGENTQPATAATAAQQAIYPKFQEPEPAEPDTSPDRLDALHQERLLAMGRMAAGVAHDFNNLLTVILGYGEQLSAEIQEPGQREQLNAVLTASRTAAGITQQLLAFGKHSLARPKLIDVDETVVSLMPLIRVSLGSRVRLLTDLQPDIGKVFAVPSQLDQVVLNLVLNARDAMPEGGEVKISTSTLTRHQASGGPVQAFVRLSVADSGTGIEPEILQHLFDPFFTTKTRSKGTGLGLAIVDSVVRSAGGEILVNSTPGVGSIFEVLLPCAAESVFSLVDLASAVERHTIPKTMFVVEPEPPPAPSSLDSYFEENAFSMSASALLATAETGPGKTPSGKRKSRGAGAKCPAVIPELAP